jgi:hypothetical protein
MDKYGNPIDKFVRNISKPVAKLMFENGFNRTGTITLSFLLGILAFKFIQDKMYVLASILYLLFYYFENVGKEITLLQGAGVNNETAFERNYSMIKNWIIHGMMIYYLFNRYSNSEGCASKNLIILIVIILVLSVMQIGCKQVGVSSDKYEDVSLVDKITLSLCPIKSKSEASSALEILKYFGEGTLVLIIAFLIATMGEFNLSDEVEKESRTAIYVPSSSSDALPKAGSPVFTSEVSSISSPEVKNTDVSSTSPLPATPTTPSAPLNINSNMTSPGTPITPNNINSNTSSNMA